ncbi:hypothetical protein PSPO01_13063 [Paraphaeosphaeria sporulosa]
MRQYDVAAAGPAAIGRFVVTSRTMGCAYTKWFPFSTPLRLGNPEHKLTSSTNEIISSSLRLPGEIHNRIYEFALTAPRPLVAYMATSNRARPVVYLIPDEDHPEVADQSITPPTTMRACDDQRHSFNHIKLVDKQVYYETRDLELHWKSCTSGQSVAGRRVYGPAPSESSLPHRAYGA